MVTFIQVVSHRVVIDLLVLDRSVFVTFGLSLATVCYFEMNFRNLATMLKTTNFGKVSETLLKDGVGYNKGIEAVCIKKLT